MSKRAEEVASRALPNYPPETYADEDEYIEVESVRSAQRAFYRKGYEQAEKDIIEKACDVLMNYVFEEVTPEMRDHFRKRLEEE